MKWEISLMAFEENGKTKYKVTRRLPLHSVAETYIFSTKQEAEQKIKQWLD